jgi:hypothetical protein
MNESTLTYWKQCFEVLRPRRRPKYTRTFKCDCGWRHNWSVSELTEQHKRHQTIVCHDCGDVYRTLGGTITATIPNPLNRSLISERDLIEKMSREDQFERHHYAACGYSDFHARFYAKLDGKQFSAAAE